MKLRRYFLLLITCIALDRISKVLILNFLRDKHLVLLPYLNFSLLWNRGVSWGLFQDVPALGFLLLTSFIIFIIFALSFYIFYIQLYKHRANITAEIILLAGALSNVIDRLLYGGVVDFIQLHIGQWYWPTFNVADVFVVCGVLLMFFKYMVVTHADQDKGNVL